MIYTVEIIQVRVRLETVLYALAEYTLKKHEYVVKDKVISCLFL